MRIVRHLCSSIQCCRSAQSFEFEPTVASFASEIEQQFIRSGSSSSSGAIQSLNDARERHEPSDIVEPIQ